ncbi:PAS-domain containing protein [Mesorhizobium koreense]|uniref:PAS-domain containing protein n=1 Tax=Mesorhizobium koreense TaxID=3074855 RepID=UPI00287BBD95|nr:PAS-domain containing protein [Mesorhizobium sp. WR6]
MEFEDEKEEEHGLSNAGTGRKDDSSKPGTRIGAGRAGSDAAGTDFHRLLEISADWTWRTDAAHIFVHLSDGVEAATGMKPKKALGRTWFDFLPMTARLNKEYQAHLDDLKAHRPFREFVYEVANAPVHCRWLSVSGYPVFDAKGMFAGYEGTGRNVTNLFATQDALDEMRGRLKQSQDLLTAVFEALDAGIVVYDQDDRLLLSNTRMAELYPHIGNIAEPGMALRDLLASAYDSGQFIDAPGAESAARTNERGGWLKERLGEYWEPYTEREQKLDDGRWVHLRNRRLDNGMFIGLRTDITAIKEREQALEDALDQARHTEVLRSALDLMEDGFALYDADDRLVLFNPAYVKMHVGMEEHIRPGMTFEAVLRAAIQFGMVEIGTTDIDAYVAEAMKRRKEGPSAEMMLHFSDGRWVMRREVRTPEGGIMGIRTDVTEMKKREEELAEASRQAEELLFDLTRTVEAMDMGVVVVDADMCAEIINPAFYEQWKMTPEQAGIGSHFRALMDINRHNGIYDLPDERWEDYVASRVGEIRAGDVSPREFKRADGRTLIYSVTALSGGKRLVSYFDITEMKDREAALAEALEKAKLAEAVIDSVPNPIFVKDRDLNFVLANNAFASIFGKKPRDIVGGKAIDVVPAAEAREFEENERQVFATGELHESEEDFELDGAPRSRVVRKNRVRTESGKDYVACTIFDITDMRRREIEAQEARQHLVNVLELLPAGVIIYDRDDKFVLANRNVQDMLHGMEATWVEGQSLEHAMRIAHEAGYFRHSDDPELDALYDTDLEAWVRGKIDKYHLPHAVYQRRNPDGRWYQVYDTRTPEGSFVGVRVDITELKEREEALRESSRENELFRSIIDNVPVAIYAKQTDLKLTYVNKGWCKLTGVECGEAVGKTDADIFGPDGEAFMRDDRAVLRSRKPQIFEETATRADGTTRYQEARKSVMAASDGSLYLIGSTTDVSEMKERERELREAQQNAVLADRAKSEFLANMSHEIRTPMNGVLGMAELLAKSDLDPKQKTFTDIIVKSGNALLTIINDILDFSKIDAGQLVLDPAPFNLVEAIEDVATLVSTRAKEKDLELIVRVDPDLPEMFVGDVGRIRQIITNLMGNAVKFTDTGHVLVDVNGVIENGAGKLRINVTDTGIGIPKDKVDLVFDKFSQVDASSTRRHEGTGLGLAITSKLVAMMGGEIGVESEFGKGSTFWFTLELPTGEVTARRKPMPIDVTGSRILIVDDNAVNRAILSEQMASWSFDACAAESGEEGLKVLHAAAQHGISVDCVVLDYQMPGMTGAEVSRIIRSTKGIANTPIILLTSVDQSLSSAQHRDLGIDAQLIKPARSSHLLETIVSAVQKHRAPDLSTIMADADHAGAALSSGGASSPVSRAAGGTAPAPSARQTGTPAIAASVEHRLDILVAEDNEVNQLVFTQILAETAMSFEIVGNGELALAAYREMQPRMILMDVSMPKMSGLEATAAIRNLEAESGTHVPIIGVTAHALKGDRERCIDAGMDDYLSKPISPKALLEKVARWSGEKPAVLLSAS